MRGVSEKKSNVYGMLRFWQCFVLFTLVGIVLSAIALTPGDDITSDSYVDFLIPSRNSVEIVDPLEADWGKMEYYERYNYLVLPRIQEQPTKTLKTRAIGLILVGVKTETTRLRRYGDLYHVRKTSPILEISAEVFDATALIVLSVLANLFVLSLVMTWFSFRSIRLAE